MKDDKYVKYVWVICSLKNISTYKDTLANYFKNA